MNSLIQARINTEIKAQAAIILGEMGLSVSDAVRILLTRIANDKSFPLELIPNSLTAETLCKSARGEDVYQAKDAQDMFNQLGI